MKNITCISLRNEYDKDWTECNLPNICQRCLKEITLNIGVSFQSPSELKLHDLECAVVFNSGILRARNDSITSQLLTTKTPMES